MRSKEPGETRRLREWIRHSFETSVARAAALRLAAWARARAEGSAILRWLTALPGVPADLWGGSALGRAAARARKAVVAAWARLPGIAGAVPAVAGRATEILLLAVAVLVALIPVKRQVGPVPVSVEVILIGLLAVAWVIHWVFRPVDPEREGPGLRTSATGLPATTFDFWFCGYLLVAVLSLLNARSLLEGVQAIARQASFFVLFYITVDALRQRVKIYRAVDAILAGALLLALIGLVQYVLGFDLSVSGLVGEEEIRGRIRSTQENPNFLSEYLILLLPVAVARWLGPAGRGRKVFYAATTLAMLAAEFLTYTRGGWLGLAVAIAVFVLLVDARYVLVAAAAAVVAVPVVPGMLERLSGLLDFSSGSGAFRLNLYRAALVMWSRSPWLGVGAGNYLEAYPDIVRDYPLLDLRFRTYSSHNAYLTVAAETGLFGLAFFLVIILLALRVAFAGWRHSARFEDRLLFLGGGCGMIAFLIQSLSNITFFHPRVAVYYWLLLALLVALHAVAAGDTGGNGEAVAGRVRIPPGRGGSPAAAAVAGAVEEPAAAGAAGIVTRERGEGS